MEERKHSPPIAMPIEPEKSLIGKDLISAKHRLNVHKFGWISLWYGRADRWRRRLCKRQCRRESTQKIPSLSNLSEFK